MNKPLSETHPTLWNNIRGLMLEHQDKIHPIIQSCTVDVVEHERVNKKFMDTAEKCYHANREVERLQKSLDYYSSVKAVTDAREAREKGLVEGERRAMQRVKEALKKCAGFGLGISDGYYGDICGDTFAKELGLDGISDSSTGGTRLPPSGEESAINNNYTNKKGA